MRKLADLGDSLLMNALAIVWTQEDKHLTLSITSRGHGALNIAFGDILFSAKMVSDHYEKRNCIVELQWDLFIRRSILCYFTYKGTMTSIRYRSGYELTKTLYSSPSWVSYGVSYVSILEKNYVIKGFGCKMIFLLSCHHNGTSVTGKTLFLDLDS